MAKVTVDQYLDFIRRSRLVDEASMKKVVEACQKAGQPMTVETLAKRFIDDQVLTNWQNDKLLVGKHQGFFLGKYKLLRHINSGGMSSVYLAEHTLMKRRVAVKVLPPAKVDDSTFLPRFMRECQAMATLNHPNIVQAHDFDAQDRLHYMVMEYIEGDDIQHLIEKVKQVDFEQAADIIRQAADGLQHAHDKNMVHRDMKPANIMLDKRGMVKVLDLGVARITGCDEGPSLTLAHNEDVLGTADFLAPEQAISSHDVDTRADVYALGCTLYYMLTGHVPFREPNLAKKLMAHQTQTPPAIQSARPDVPPDLAAICDKMMAKSRDDRFQTMTEVSKALSEFLEASRKARQPVVAAPVAVPRTPPLPTPGFPGGRPGAAASLKTPPPASASPLTLASLLGQEEAKEPEPAPPAPEPAPVKAEAPPSPPPAPASKEDLPLSSPVHASQAAMISTDDESISAVRVPSSASAPGPVSSVAVNAALGSAAQLDEVSQYGVAEPQKPLVQPSVPIYQEDSDLDGSKSDLGGHAPAGRSSASAAVRTPAAPRGATETARSPVRQLQSSPAKPKNGKVATTIALVISVIVLAAVVGVLAFVIAQQMMKPSTGPRATPTTEAPAPPPSPTAPSGPENG